MGLEQEPAFYPAVFIIFRRLIRRGGEEDPPGGTFIFIQQFPVIFIEGMEILQVIYPQAPGGGVIKPDTLHPDFKP
jgi:hypothetical protein